MPTHFQFEQLILLVLHVTGQGILKVKVKHSFVSGRRIVWK